MLDKFINGFDQMLRVVCPPDSRISERANPAKSIPIPILNDKQRKHVAGLMRVNHAGEVCAQALYQGQAMTARSLHTQKHMQQAVKEEIDHLAWCEERLQELDSKPSILNPFWYLGSLSIGAIAGILGDPISLGFVEETELQVTSHLEKHIDQLPIEDVRSHTILSQMKTDEMAHAAMAAHAGSLELPYVVKKMMRWSSRVMTTLSYYL